VSSWRFRPCAARRRRAPPAKGQILALNHPHWSCKKMQEEKGWESGKAARTVSAHGLKGHRQDHAVVGRPRLSRSRRGRPTTPPAVGCSPWLREPSVKRSRFHQPIAVALVAQRRGLSWGPPAKILGGPDWSAGLSSLEAYPAKTRQPFMPFRSDVWADELHGLWTKCSQLLRE
jgi:hypothetical protein